MSFYNDTAGGYYPQYVAQSRAGLCALLNRTLLVDTSAGVGTDPGFFYQQGQWMVNWGGDDGCALWVPVAPGWKVGDTWPVDGSAQVTMWDFVPMSTCDGSLSPGGASGSCPVPTMAGSGAVAGFKFTTSVSELQAMANGGIQQAGTESSPIYMAFAPSTASSGVGPFELTGDKASDYLDVFWMFALVAATLVSFKVLKRLFSGDTDHG